jgi:histidinol-phosphate phosphatase family protein
VSEKAVFLDRDGTLIRNVPHNVDPARVELTPLAGYALKLLRSNGYRLLLVSNQPGVARGYFSRSALRAVDERIQALLGRDDTALDGFYYCPHLPGGEVRHYAVHCTCRKPQPGLLRRAAAEHGVDLGRSWLIGDVLDDIEAGRRAGCRTVLIVNGNETEWRVDGDRAPHRFASNLGKAARLIVAETAAREAHEARRAKDLGDGR